MQPVGGRLIFIKGGKDSSCGVWQKKSPGGGVSLVRVQKYKIMKQSRKSEV